MPTAPLSRPLPRQWAVRVIVAGGLLPLAIGACGGSSSPHTSRAKPSATKGESHSVHASLTGQNHNPIVKQNWKYTVTASDPHGHPLSGSVDTEFAFQGNVVGHETPSTHKLKHGLMKDTLQFPATAAGYPIELQVVVHTHAGSVTLDWPVTVHK